MNLAHGSLTKYLKWVSEKVDRHQAFMRSLKEWVKKHNSEGSQRLRDRSALAAAQAVTATEGRGRRFKKNWLFIEKDAYELESTPEEIAAAVYVTEDIDGVELEGIWVHKGKKGHHEVEDFVEKGVRKDTIIDDGQNQLDKDQSDTKFKALAQVFKDDEKAVSGKAKDMQSMESLLDILGLVGTRTKRPDSGNTDEEDDCSGGEPSTDEGESLDEDADDRASLLGRKTGNKKAVVKAKQKASPMATTGKALSSFSSSVTQLKASPSTTTGGGSSAASSASSNMAANAAKPSPSTSLQPGASPLGVIALDGRGERLKKSLRDGIADLEKELAKLKDIPCVEQDGSAASQKGARDKLKAHMKTGNNLLTKVNAMVGKLDKSPNKSHYEQESQDLESLRGATDACISLIKVLTGSGQATHAIIESIETAKKYGVEMSLHFEKEFFKAKAVSYIQYQQYDAFCDLFLPLSVQAASTSFLSWFLFSVWGTRC